MHAHDPIMLVVQLTEGLSSYPLPDDALAKLRGERRMTDGDRDAMRLAFDEALSSPTLSDEQRVRLRDLVDTVLPGSTSTNGAPMPPGPAVPTESSPAAPEPEPLHDGTSPRRRWPLALSVGVAVAAITAVSYLAWSNYTRGEHWREQAVAAEADVERLIAANDTLVTDVEDLQDALERSEADVRLLERRLSRAANEKARVEDEREQANAFAERLAEIALAYDDVADWFSACRDEQSALTTMVFDFEDYYFANQTYLISNQINRATETCGTAERSLADLRAYLGGLTP